MSIASLNRVTLKVANHLILDEVDWHIQPQDKIALVGRNGTGKSSLLKLLQHEIVADKGQYQHVNGLKISGLTQEVFSESTEPVYNFLVQELNPELKQVLIHYQHLLITNNLKELADAQLKMDALHAWDVLPRVDMVASRLGVEPNALMGDLSGGMKRRVLLAAALIAEPDLLLLDEPTNHLDISTIEWLESYLKTFHGALIVVTHDRNFLNVVANRIVELDRGKLFSYQGDFEAYLNYRAAREKDEERHHALFDKRLSDEETWIRTGVKARRTRNEGRVRALKAMREEYKARRNKLGKVEGLTPTGTRSSEIIFEVDGVSFAYQDQPIIQDLSLLVTRGDKLGIIGANGSGKTTLIRLLLGELSPQSGSIKQGKSLEIAYFDQLRAVLNEQQTVMANVAEGADYVTINGQHKHVASYLKEFLFDPERFQQRVSTLSGGERNRLLLAKLLAKPINLLIMDEPTNDLDMETLELLETKLIDYAGTLLIISHDRTFIDNVVTSVLVAEENGQFIEHIGGYSDYKEYKKTAPAPVAILSKPVEFTKNKKADKLSYNEQRELKDLPAKIEKLEQKILKLQLEMTSPEFYQQDALTIGKISKDLLLDEQALTALYQRWEELDNKGA